MIFKLQEANVKFNENLLSQAYLRQVPNLLNVDFFLFCFWPMFLANEARNCLDSRGAESVLKLVLKSRESMVSRVSVSQKQSR